MGGCLNIKKRYNLHNDNINIRIDDLSVVRRLISQVSYKICGGFLSHHESIIRPSTLIQTMALESWCPN